MSSDHEDSGSDSEIEAPARRVDSTARANEKLREATRAPTVTKKDSDEDEVEEDIPYVPPPILSEGSTWCPTLRGRVVKDITEEISKLSSPSEMFNLIRETLETNNIVRVTNSYERAIAIRKFANNRRNEFKYICEADLGGCNFCITDCDTTDDQPVWASAYKLYRLPSPPCTKDEAVRAIPYGTTILEFPEGPTDFWTLCDLGEAPDTIEEIDFGYDVLLTGSVDTDTALDMILCALHRLKIIHCSVRSDFYPRLAQLHSTGRLQALHTLTDY